MASIGFMFGVTTGDLSFTTVTGGLAFLLLGGGIFFGAMNMSRGWDGGEEG
jgi:hypothetical protein